MQLYRLSLVRPSFNNSTAFMMPTFFLFSFENGNRLCYFETEKDWDDIKFGVDNQVDFYAVSFVKDAEVIHELKNYLKSK